MTNKIIYDAHYCVRAHFTPEDIYKLKTFIVNTLSSGFINKLQEATCTNTGSKKKLVGCVLRSLMVNPAPQSSLCGGLSGFYLESGLH